MSEVVEVKEKRTGALKKATDISLFYLERKGAEILERNWTGTSGRADLIFLVGLGSDVCQSLTSRLHPDSLPEEKNHGQAATEV